MVKRGNGETGKRGNGETGKRGNGETGKEWWQALPLGAV